MSVQRDDEKTNQPQSLLLRADEVDSGTTIASSSDQKPLSALTPVESLSTGTARPKPPPRPVLRREGSGPPPPPPSQPPPAPPPMQPENATDSLSLPQLKQLVSQFPKVEQRAYAYQYREAEDFVTEVDEWFHYAEIEQDREYLLATREVFEQRWKMYCQSELKSNDATWIEVSTPHRESFMKLLVSELSEEDATIGFDALASIYYVLTGAWSITAGLELECQDSEAKALPNKNNAIQMEWMHKAADLFASKHGLKPVYQRLRKALEQTHDELTENIEEETDSFFNDSQYREISLCMSCLYLTVESARVRPHENAMTMVRDAFMSLEPNLSVYLVSVISKLRWDESYNIPLMHALQLLWKLTLLCFGDLKNHLEKIKSILQPRVDPFSSEAARPILTASPLDYHLFRQEITSKYPAYNPPPPLIPLELEQKTMLPPATSARHESYDHFAGQASTTTGSSILHQPVHIATPAPSPPPSPAGPGGKAGKKQNYQTNQNFPFLYPPLDSASNNIGGKGTTELQDAMVGRKWDGSDIPASIIEAGELFASRMRMTRAMRQLWTERDLFMKYDRGWDADLPVRSATNIPTQSQGKDKGQADDLADPELQNRMKAVDDFFHHALPDLQSLIIVMMKVMLTNVQDIAVRNGISQEGQTNGLNRNKSNSNMAQGQALPIPPPPPRPNEIHLDDLDNVRSREISQKAISAFLFLLLKWSKTSHVLKFEYITQLLLDSNYVQLTLKYFAHQNLEDLVAFSYDRTDLSFWHYCHVHSDHPPLSPTSPDSHPQSEADNEHDASSLDDAIPPPIQRHRQSPTSSLDSLPPPSVFASPELSQSMQQDSAYPTVDELGNPIGPVPQTPIEEFSARQFQTSIHLLRLLQKLSRAKSHRILLLVQFKSSQILRRILRVPDTLLRLYVLKLFKSQVPYCGRKWRQSNMRVITAIYLHCRPELRDEWLAGMHDSNVEGEVDEAVPLEWALRGLTYWWMKRTYPDVMKLKQARRQDKGKSVTHRALAGEQANDENSAKMEDSNDDDGMADGGQEIDDEERDFFQRELDAMGWGLAGLGFGAGEDVGFGEEAPGVMSAFPTGVGANGMNGDHQGWEHVNMGQANIETWS